MINKHDKDKLIDSFGHFAFNWFFASPGLMVHLVDVSINIVQVCVLYKVEKQLITNKGQSLLVSCSWLLTYQYLSAIFVLHIKNWPSSNTPICSSCCLNWFLYNQSPSIHLWELDLSTDSLLVHFQVHHFFKLFLEW